MEEFYNTLENAYDSLPNNDIKLVLVDFNAKIGQEQMFIGTIDKYSMHRETSDNGLRLIDFATSKGLIISSTCFMHKDIHKPTWISPDGETRNQIDHILIEKRHATCILDVRSMRGTSCGSDHLLVKPHFTDQIRNKQRFIPSLLDLILIK